MFVVPGACKGEGAYNVNYRKIEHAAIMTSGKLSAQFMTQVYAGYTYNMRKWLRRGTSTGIASDCRPIASMWTWKAKEKAQSCSCVANEKDSTAFHKAWALCLLKGGHWSTATGVVSMSSWLRWQLLEVPHVPQSFSWVRPSWESARSTCTGLEHVHSVHRLAV